MKLDKFLTVLLVVAIVVTITATFLNMYRINKLGITGYGTAGYVNVTINASTTINVTAVNCNFGSGWITPLQTLATLESNETKVNWDGAGTNVSLEVKNDGNVNVTLNVSSVKTLTSFYGIDCSADNCEYKFWTDDKEANACRNATGTGDGNVAHPGTSMDTTQKTACPRLQFYDATDEIYVYCRLVIHETVAPGSKTDTWTFYAVQT